MPFTVYVYILWFNLQFESHVHDKPLKVSFLNFLEQVN